MKNYLTLSLLFLAIAGNSQTSLTVGEIFDFNVDDEFQTFNDYPQGRPPNAIRMKVIGKHFSATNDTVFYTRSFDNYYTVLNPNPSPHLDYYFDTYIDSVFYTNLNDNVLNNSPDTSCNLIVDTTICGIPANGWECLGIEEYVSEVFGKGLGVVRDVYVQNGSPSQSYDHKIFYFKKDTMECGTPDLTTSISLNRISLGIENIYPNPFTDNFRIRFADDKHSYRINIFDLRGTEIFETTVDYCDHVVIDKINKKGIYMIKIETGDKSYTTKIIKK